MLENIYRFYFVGGEIGFGIFYMIYFNYGVINVRCYYVCFSFFVICNKFFCVV